MVTPTNYFAGTEFEDSIENEKRALLAFVAERGTEGQAAYEAARSSSTAARAASSERAAARGAAINSSEALNTEIQNDYDLVNNVYRDQLSQSQLSHGREMDRIALADAAYQNAIKAAGGPLGQILQQQLDMRNAGGGGGGGGYSGGSATGDEALDIANTLPKLATRGGEALGLPAKNRPGRAPRTPVGRGRERDQRYVSPESAKDTSRGPGRRGTGRSANEAWYS